MTKDWIFILRGLLIAILGAVGVMCYILGLTNLYIGFYGMGAGYLIGSGVLIAFFQKVLAPYLDILEALGTDAEMGGDA